MSGPTFVGYWQAYVSSEELNHCLSTGDFSTQDLVVSEECSEYPSLRGVGEGTSQMGVILTVCLKRFVAFSEVTTRSRQAHDQRTQQQMTANIIGMFLKVIGMFLKVMITILTVM